MSSSGEGPVGRGRSFPSLPPEAVATYNKATGWLNVTFPSKPSDDTLQGLRSLGFRYQPSSKRWSAAYRPDREDHLKGLAGKVEEVNIAPNWAAKAEHASEQAAKHYEKSQEHEQKADAISSVIPFGQPILVGHHSEAHHRSDLAKIDSNIHKAIEEREIGDELKERAERYGAKATGENPVTIHNRIKKLEADQRKFQKNVDEAKWAHQSEANMRTAQNSGFNTDLEWAEKWLKYYTERLEVERPKYTASGGISTDTLQVQVGDTVETQFGRAKITKVNQKSLIVDFEQDSLGPFHKIDKTTVLRKVS